MVTPTGMAAAPSTWISYFSCAPTRAKAATRRATRVAGRIDGFMGIVRSDERSCHFEQPLELPIAQRSPVGRTGKDPPPAEDRIEQQSRILGLGWILPVESPGDGPLRFVVDLPFDPGRVDEEATVFHLSSPSRTCCAYG